MRRQRNALLLIDKEVATETSAPFKLLYCEEICEKYKRIAATVGVFGIEGILQQTP
jgi:hypothetical protein